MELFQHPLVAGTATNAVKSTLQTLNATATAVGTFTIKPGKVESEYLSALLAVKNLATETVLLTGSMDGTNFSGSLLPRDAATGLVVTAAALGNGDYVIDPLWPYSQYKLVKSATTDRVFAALAVTSIPKF